MKAVELTKGIYWVGSVDWDLRNFHGYLTQRGSSYNAYLILDEKVTLIDNVKAHLASDLIERISDVIDPAKIDYIVQNHIEMDHSGSLPHILTYCPNATLFASPKGIEGIKKHYEIDRHCTAVTTGDTLPLGKRTLHFLQTPMVHWPDNMVSYCPEDKILFSNDAFGQHIASSERFDDEYSLGIAMQEAAKYYANIVLPYSAQVQKALEAAGSLDISTICPSHGLIWRKHISSIMEAYGNWSANRTDHKALIIYDTMWKSTEKLAIAVKNAFESKGFSIRLINLQHSHISDIMTEILTASHICIGSPTLNNNILPTVAAFLTYLKGLAPKGRTGMAFGSYGWGGQSVGMVEESLKQCGFELLESVRVQYIPDEETLQSITNRVKEQI